MLQATFDGIKNLLIGMGVTFRNMLTTPVTLQYPEVKRTMPKRYRGRHFLNRDEDGLEKCIGCSLCSINCPVGCIHVVSDRVFRWPATAAAERLGTSSA